MIFTKQELDEAWEIGKKLLQNLPEYEDLINNIRRMTKMDKCDEYDFNHPPLTTTFNGLEKILRKIPPDMEWLVRSDKALREDSGGYYANICTRNFAQSAGREGYRYTAYGATPEIALREALRRSALGEHNNPSFTKNPGDS